MDVDAVWRTKGKAKGKHKGKGKKGVGKTGQTQGKKGLTGVMEEEADVSYFGGYKGTCKKGRSGHKGKCKEKGKGTGKGKIQVWRRRCGRTGHATYR